MGPLGAGSDGRERDTEAIYFSLLQAVGRNLDLRIIVDSVAGASAGGISGIILARALAPDLSVDHLRSGWLEEADVLRLLAKSQRARAWSKWYLYPMLWILLHSRMFELAMGREVRRKLSTFFRSRWFEAPFDGDRFLESLFDGLSDMRQSDIAPSSLLPPGHVLDLAASVTDFFGYPRRIRINTPADIQEREQGLLWKFSCCHWKDKREISDFDDDNLPSLALAARATSSFPGAFPPMPTANFILLAQRRESGDACTHGRCAQTDLVDSHRAVPITSFARGGDRVAAPPAQCAAKKIAEAARLQQFQPARFCRSLSNSRRAY